MTKDGAWIGLDWGTSNAAAAVYDGTRGGSKWMRLKGLASQQQLRKAGRVVPTVVVLSEKQLSVDWRDVRLILQRTEAIYALVGAEAVAFLDNSFTSQAPPSPHSPAKMQNATIRSSKRRVLRHEEPIVVTPLGSSSALELSAIDVIALFLSRMRVACNAYLHKEVTRKHLRIPGTPHLCRHVCIGVPAASDVSYRQTVAAAALRSGFASCSTLTESTAAAMAYGLTLNHASSSKRIIVVVDIGGGTTDVTVTESSSSDDNSARTSSVVLTAGSNIGGDDMDLAIYTWLGSQLAVPERDDALLTQCRRAKLELCGDKHVEPSESSTIVVNGQTVPITQTDWNSCLQPILDEIQLLLDDSILPQYPEVDEVVLIGGASRVPAIRALLRCVWSAVPELCTALNPDSSVAQGCAISAALESELVPLHALQSALMLDTAPHPIGALVQDSNTFVQIIPRGATLPASGCATFLLAKASQPGVTVHAVERVGEKDYNQLGVFSFLLHRLPHQALCRSVDIGMTLERGGQFVVSIFDPLDPEHQRKKQRYLQAKESSTVTIDFVDDSWTTEQVLLIASCAFLFLLYVGVKIAFSDAVAGEL